jgi:hypothetical protein
MTGMVLGVGGMAVLFAVFTLLQRGRDDTPTCGNCGCNAYCERDGHLIVGDITESRHAKT